MPEDPNTKPQSGGEPGGGGEPSGQEPEGTPGPYLGTYATKEDAEKGLQEMQATIGKLTGELGHVKAQQGTRDELVNALKQFSEQQSPQQQQAAPVNWGEIEKAVEDGNGKVLVGLIQDVIASTAGKTEIQGAVKPLLEKIDALEARVRDADPDYRKHRDTVAELQKQIPGLGRDQAVAVAAVIDAHKPSAPPADEAPGSTAATRVSEPPPTRQFTDQERALLDRVIPGGVRKEEWERLEGRS